MSAISCRGSGRRRTTRGEGDVPGQAFTKNWLFIGHPKAGQRSAIIYTMVENCRLHGIDPLAYLTDVMPRLLDRDAGADVSDLLPKQWKAAHNPR